MKRVFIVCVILYSLTGAAQIKYPESRKDETVDQYGGVRVLDPYRWLEDDNSEETKKWVKDQNKVTFDYLSTIPFRDKIKKRLEQLWNYPKYSSPSKKGEYYYYFRNEGMQDQPVLFRQKGLKGEAEEFLNPNSLGNDGLAAIGTTSFSKTGKYFAYSMSVAGSDWQQIFVMDANTRQKLTDKTEWTKFSAIVWNGDEGFYYSGYDRPDEKSKLSKQNRFHKVFYHKIGTRQSDDKLIFDDKEHPLRYHRAGLTEDGRFLILTKSEGTSGTELWYRDNHDATQKEFRLLIGGFNTQAAVIDNMGSHLLVRTNQDAPNYKVVLIDPKSPAPGKWKTIIPERPEALQSVTTSGGNLFANYLKDASSKISQHGYDGKLIREITLPGIGTASGFTGDKDAKELFYTYSSFNTPPAIYIYDIANGQSTLFRNTTLGMNPAKFVTEQIFIKGKDGVDIPVFLTHKTGMEMNGNNPVLLYGYGGFNIPITPSFSISNAFFMEQGGIYAVVNLRGGSEYGERWHKDGMLDKKQNVFNDFIAAAEGLIERGYTNRQKLAIQGASNGGLLVGAVMTQRPDLCKVALPAVGVMDMLRFHKFTVGWGWTVEYGNADSASQFPYLYKYSPYHNLNPNIHYPATLVTTADHDDRVVPAHSFKYAARLQEYNASNNPVLIRVETNAGHGAGKPTGKQIEEAADVWSFVMYNLGMNFDPNAENEKAKAEPSRLQKAMDARKGAKPVPQKQKGF